MDERQLKDFGTRVRRRREALNLTRQALCKEAGITRTTLRRLEAGGQHPTLRTLALLVTALQMPDEESLTGAAPVKLDHSLLEDLIEEDLEVAQRFHHAPTRVKTRILDLLDQAPSRLRPRSSEVLDDRRRGTAAAAAPPGDDTADASASVDARLATAFAGLDPTTRQKLTDVVLGLTKAHHRAVKSAEDRPAGPSPRSKRR